MIITKTNSVILNGDKYSFIQNNKKYSPAYQEKFDDINTVFLIHGNSILDSSLYNVQIINNGVGTSTAQSKFGSGSLFFDGSSRLLFPSSTIVFGNNNFTIEWWEYPTTTFTNKNGTRFSSLYTTQQNQYGGFLIGYNSTNVYCSSLLSNSWDLVSGEKMIDVSPNQWTHWAFIRIGNRLYSYKNGNLFSSTELVGTIVYNDSINMCIGDYRVGDPSYFTGYIEEFRISNVARWSSNFIPPTKPYEV